jgi:mxaA protein
MTMTMTMAACRSSFMAARTATLTAALSAAGMAALFATLCSLAAPAQAQNAPAAIEIEPRAFGYSVGDVLQRRVRLTWPEGWSLDLSSLPKLRRPGQAIELRAVQLDGQELRLEYQVFLAPKAVRTLEIAPMRLRFAGPGGEAFVRIDAWPVTVAPLVPVDVSPRVGLGEMQPDIAPPAIATQARHQRLWWYAAALLLGGLYLLHVYIGLPWWGRRRRPFALASRALRRLPADPSTQDWHGAMRLVHEALNATAGEVVFEGGLSRFVAEQPRFAPLQASLAGFFRRSHDVFFSGQGAEADLPWLLALCRDCRHAERGGA